MFTQAIISGMHRLRCAAEPAVLLARLGVAAALTATTLASPAAVPTASAHEDTVAYQIIVVVHKVDELTMLDNITSGDFYARINIDGQTHQTDTTIDRYTITPDWLYRVGKARTELVDQFVPVSIGIWDSDNGRNAWIDPDDHVDITPGAGPSLEMLVNFADPLSADLGGILIDANTGDELGVFRPTGNVDGRPVAWKSVPRQGPNDAYLASRGAASDRAEMEYRVWIHRVPDFRVNQVNRRDDGSTDVVVVNSGGPGTLTRVTCSNANGPVRVDVAQFMSAGTRTTVNVPISRPTSCTVAGENWYGWGEPHTDNNALAV
jgi:hypothetical protein